MEYTNKQLIAYLALGANLPSQLGDPTETLSGALAALEKKGVTRLAVSPFYATPCFPVGAGPDYVNACCSVNFAGTPAELLAVLHDVEAQFGRRRETRWAGRTLDLDLLAVGDQILPDRETHDAWRNLPTDVQAQKAPGRLILPHPRLQDRAFVLIPFRDIAPQWEHPILQKTVQELCADLPKAEVDAIQPANSAKNPSVSHD